MTFETIQLYHYCVLTPRIDEQMSSGNITVVEGETVMLVCTVLQLGDKSVSTAQWCR